MKDKLNREIGQAEKFKKLCVDLRSKGIKKTDSEIIEIAMELLRIKFKI